MNEFNLIDRYFKPLARAFPGSLGLTDDAAVFAPPAGQELVITKDAITKGIHYLGHEDPALIAKKLLRSNLSDLAAMGAAPLCYFLAIGLPKAEEAFLTRFAQGLAEDQEMFGITIAGGDTIRTQHDDVFSLTALGTVPQGQALRRNGARPGDLIYVSGTIGDAALGLQLLLRHPREGGDDSFLIERYLLPQPRLILGQALRGIASACMDISDGLLQDLGHLCAASCCGAIIHYSQIPLSDAAVQHDIKPEIILAGGDDYELLFTVPPENKSMLKEIPDIQCIGEITESSIQIVDEAGNPITLPKSGFRHFV